MSEKIETPINSKTPPSNTSSLMLARRPLFFVGALADTLPLLELLPLLDWR
jgi:hypothetical protein